MLQRSINCDFFKVLLPSDMDARFEEFVTQVLANHKSTQSRNYELEDGTYLRLHVWEGIHTVYKGAILRLRPENAPMVTHIDSDILADVKLAKNEILCEYLCFLYFPHSSTLVCQRNVHVGRVGAFATYLEEKSGIFPVDFQQMLNTEAWQRLEKADQVRKVEVCFAFPKNLQVFNTGNTSVDEMISLAHQSGATVLTMSLSVGRNGSGMISTVKNLVRRLSRPDGNIDVKKLKVISKDFDTSSYLIDLIADRMQTSATIKFEGRSPKLDDVWNALYSAYDQLRPEIDRQMKLDMK